MSNLHWLIVGGTPRSGTTALMDSLNQHPQIALVPEWNSEKIFRSLNVLFDREKSLLNKGWLGDTNLHSRGDARVTVNSFGAYIPRRASMDTMLITLYRETFGKEMMVLGEKLPAYWSMNLDWLRAQVGRLSVIHIVRRPSYVIASFRHRSWLRSLGRDLWKLNAPDEGLHQWLAGWKTLAEFSAGHRDIDFYPVKYEDMFSGNGEFFRIQSFLGVAPVELPLFVEGEKKPEHNPETYPALNLLDDLEADWHLSLADLQKKYPVEMLISRYRAQHPLRYLVRRLRIR